MSPRKPATATPRPPPLPRRASGTRAAVKAARPQKPPPAIEFLADEFVEDEVEFLPQEFVADEAPGEAAVGFAGPSDPPPRAPVPAPPAAQGPAVARQATPAAGARGKVSQWIPTAAAAAFGFLAVALALRTRTPQDAHAEAPSAAPGSGLSLVASEESPLRPAPTEPVASASAPAAVSAQPVEPASGPPAPDPTAATEAKHASQKALEHGNLPQAIALGEHAVELDATDAEGWLILGAAYLQRGSFKDARRCFSSCVKEADHGPRGECAALLR